MSDERARSFSASTASAADDGARGTGTTRVKRGLADMMKGGVIMDVVNAEQARIAEDAGAVAVMALERVPADIRAQGGVARMSDPDLIDGIVEAVSIPVMAKARIGHFVEAQVLQALKVDFIDESEVLSPADYVNHIDKWDFDVPFVCGATNLGEALRRITEGAAMIRSKGEAGTGDVSEAVKHIRTIRKEIAQLQGLAQDELYVAAKELQAPYELVAEVAAAGALQLQVEAVRKQLGQLERHIARLLRLPLQQRLPDRPRLRTRQQDQPVGQLGQPGPAHHRLRLDHALRPRAGQQLGQVQVALVVDHQQQHAAGRVLLRLAPLQEHLGTDQRLDAGAARGLVELDGAKQVADVAEGEGREHRRGTRGDGRTQEDAVHRDDLRGVRGEHVVRVEVHEREDRESHGPGHAADGTGDHRADPRDDAQVVQVLRHAHQDREEDQGVPGGAVLGHVVPGEHLGHQQHRDADDGHEIEVPLDALILCQGLSPTLAPLESWQLPMEGRYLPVDPATMASAIPGIHAVGDICTYPGKLKLIVTGFAEAARAAQSVAQFIAGKPPLFEYTAISLRQQRRLGVLTEETLATRLRPHLHFPEGL